MTQCCLVCLILVHARICKESHLADANTGRARMSAEDAGSLFMLAYSVLTGNCNAGLLYAAVFIETCR
jgi:hypothetical protein